MTREQDRDDRRVERGDVFDQFETADLRHSHIGVNETICRRLSFDSVSARRAVFCCIGRNPFAAQRIREGVAAFFFIVND